MKNTAHSFLVVTGFSIATRLASFIFKMWMSRSLGAEIVGVYQIALSVLFVASFVMMICTKNSENAGIRPYNIGIDESGMGIHTKSRATSVMASAKGCNSPSCLLPIRRIAMSKTKYKIKHLINKLSIRIVCL